MFKLILFKKFQSCKKHENHLSAYDKLSLALNSTNHHVYSNISTYKTQTWTPKMKCGAYDKLSLKKFNFFFFYFHCSDSTNHHVYSNISSYETVTQTRMPKTTDSSNN